MNINYLTSVIDSVEEFFNTNFNLSLHRKELELHEAFFSVKDGIFLNLTGNIEGKILLTYTEQFKEYLSDHLVADLGENILDKELKIAALKEFLNQLSGHIITRIEERGYNWDIDVPVFIENGYPEMESMNLETVEIPYENEKIGNMKIKIALKDLGE